MIETLDLLRLFGGFVYLALGGDLLVRGALGLSRRTSLSPIIVGVTIVALGTSAPELVISVFASATGHTGVALGNVVGSNIANVLLVLGLPALISPIVIDGRGIRRHCLFMFAVSLALVFLTMDGVLSTAEGIVFVTTLGILLLVIFRRGLTIPGADLVDVSDQFQRVLGLPSRLPTALGFVSAGILLLPLGADLTVEGATALSASLGIPEVVVGSTIVALGTSLPELTTTVIAALHRSSGIAIGNVIGSNVFNILLVAGASAIVTPLPVPAGLRGFDLRIMLGAAFVTLLFVVFRRPVDRLAGCVFLTAYLGYLWYVI